MARRRRTELCLAAAGIRRPSPHHRSIPCPAPSDAVRRLMDGDMTAENEIERMDQAIRANPEYERRQKEQALAWQRANDEPNANALREMRALIPINVSSSSAQSMIDRGLPRSVARRIWAKKALWLLRIHVDDIRKIHIADLQARRRG